MASIRSPRYRKDGSVYHSVLYTLNGKQTSSSFNDPAEAVRFQKLANSVGPAKALEVWRATQSSGDGGFTVASWCTYHVDHLTGANEATRKKYRRYIANDIAPSKICHLPLTALTNADVAQWLNSLTGSAKTAHLGQPLRWQPVAPRRTIRNGVPDPRRVCLAAFLR
jgi:hypothetical protein